MSIYIKFNTENLPWEIRWRTEPDRAYKIRAVTKRKMYLECTDTRYVCITMTHGEAFQYTNITNREHIKDMYYVFSQNDQEKMTYYSLIYSRP